MVRTRVNELLKTEYPIILGGLKGLGTGELAASVSEAGGFGLITSGSFEGKKDLMNEIEKVRGLTDKPFGVNIS